MEPIDLEKIIDADYSLRLKTRRNTLNIWQQGVAHSSGYSNYLCKNKVSLFVFWGCGLCAGLASSLALYYDTLFMEGLVSVNRALLCLVVFGVYSVSICYLAPYAKGVNDYLKRHWKGNKAFKSELKVIGSAVCESDVAKELARTSSSKYGRVRDDAQRFVNTGKLGDKPLSDLDSVMLIISAVGTVHRKRATYELEASQKA